MLNQELWEKISSYPIDDSSSKFTFSRRLAQENNWSYPYALRVIEEYKKFVFLAMTLEHKVTPSDEVDQVWHLHMIYTREYWEEFHTILPRKLHHGPTKGGTTEDIKYDDWYSKTKESYEKVFGEPPPSDIWPSNDVRFGRRFMRLNIDSYVIIKQKDYPFVSKVIINFFSLLNKITFKK